MALLYMHIPFCKRKCAYCDFTSFAGETSQFRAIVDRMKAEMDAAEGLSMRTVYIGGGTPTILPASHLVELLSHARQRFSIAEDAEITVETNPGTVDESALEALHAAGVNRLSIGAQAKQDSLLKMLGRIHNWQEVEQTVNAAKRVGFSNISLDLMYGLPGQTPRDFRETLTAALALSPKHLSAYSLIIEEATPFFDQYESHPELLPSEDALAEMADDIAWMTQDAGLSRYEISNYALPGYESQHNMGYWLREDYLGIGCGAHSLLRNFRFANAPTLEAYLRGERVDEQVISEDEARFERLMMGLRLISGIPWEEQALFDAYREKFRALRERGLLDYNEGRVWLTERGLDVQNRVLLALMEDD